MVTPEAERTQNPYQKAIREFIAAAGERGTTDLKHFELPDGTCGWEQVLGSGKEWRGLGYDKERRTLWLCLDPGPIRENDRWNANTLLDLERSPIVKRVEDKVRVALPPKHPVAKLIANLPENSFAFLPGTWNGWNPNDERARFKVEADGAAVCELPISVATQLEIKVAIPNLQADWEDGGWQMGARQKITIKPQT